MKTVLVSFTFDPTKYDQTDTRENALNIVREILRGGADYPDESTASVWLACDGKAVDLRPGALVEDSKQPGVCADWLDKDGWLSVPVGHLVFIVRMVGNTTINQVARRTNSGFVDHADEGIPMSEIKYLATTLRPTFETVI